MSTPHRWSEALEDLSRPWSRARHRAGLTRIRLCTRTTSIDRRIEVRSARTRAGGITLPYEARREEVSHDDVAIPPTDRFRPSAWSDSAALGLRASTSPGLWIEDRDLTVVVGAKAQAKAPCGRAPARRAKRRDRLVTSTPSMVAGADGTVAEVMYRVGVDEEPIVDERRFDLRERRARLERAEGRTDAPTPDRDPRLGDRVEQIDPTGRHRVDQRLNVDAASQAAWRRSATATAMATGSDYADGDGRGGGYCDGRGAVGRAGSSRPPTSIRGGPAGRRREPRSVPATSTAPSRSGGTDGRASMNVAGGFPLDASVMRPRAEVLFELWLSSVLRNPAARRADAGSRVLPGLEDRSAVARLEDRVTDALLEVNRLSRRARPTSSETSASTWTLTWLAPSTSTS